MMMMIRMGASGDDLCVSGVRLSTCVFPFFWYLLALTPAANGSIMSKKKVRLFLQTFQVERKPAAVYGADTGGEVS